MSEAISSGNKALEPASPFGRFILNNKKKLIVASFFLAFLPTLVLEILTESGGIGSALREARENAQQQTANGLALSLIHYANDHKGNFPQGKSSTEVFQQLIDGGYLNNTDSLYLRMPGKVKATSKHLKPENICWDVTNGVRQDDSDGLPLVFVTGYKIDYSPNGKAHPLAGSDPDGLAVGYLDGDSRFIFLRGFDRKPMDMPITPERFDPKGRTYQQITPDGSLP